MPVFVVGMNGSGTTMLADCLGNHPDLFMFPFETRVLPSIINNISSYGDLSEIQPRIKLAKKIGNCRAYWKFNGKKKVELEKELLSEPGIDGVLNSLYGYFAAIEGKKRWGDKTPMYVQHILLLAKNIPKAKFIHIYRDGRDMAQSFNRRWGYSCQRSIYRWKKIVEFGRTQGRELGKDRYFEISYEQLTSNPEFIMKKICGFIDLPFHPNVLESSMPYFVKNNHDKNKGRITQNTGKWQSYFSTEELLRLESIAGNCLEKFGYCTLNPHGDWDPPKYQLLWWLLRDRFNLTKNFVLHGDLKKTNEFLRRAKESIIQNMSNRF